MSLNNVGYKKVVVTGANGFIGKNLSVVLEKIEGIEVGYIHSSTPKSTYSKLIREADFIYHLAGVNRPKNPSDFEVSNTNFTSEILEYTREGGKTPTFVFSSSTQADLENTYGRSKLAAENVIKEYANSGYISAVIYRLPGVFGKWSKPNYNSVVTTFCYNIARNIPIEVRDTNQEISLVYIDDVVKYLTSHLKQTHRGCFYADVQLVYTITLGELASRIKSFPTLRKTLYAPKVGDSLEKRLYSTYLSYLPIKNFSYPLDLKKDDRGDLFEWIKSEDFGQIFVSTTKPGVTRGNHFHHLKTEKFLVIRGEAEIKFRNIASDEVVSYSVDGNKPTVLDIPTGYTHSITNTGNSDLITLFWANEIFNKQEPDTYFLEV